jgi:hypothetical protein
MTVALFFCCGVVPAKATYLTNNFTFGQLNQVRDDSIETVIDVNGNNKLDAGDVIFGITMVNSQSPPTTTTTQHVYGVFSTQVAGVNPNGTNFDTYFAPTTASGYDLSTLTGGKVKATTTTGLIAVFSSDSSIGDLVNAASPASTFNNMTDYINYIVSHSTLDFVAGIDPAQGGVSSTGPTAAQPDYWHGLTQPAGAALSGTNGLLAADNTYLNDPTLSGLALDHYGSADTIAAVDAGMVMVQVNDGVTYGKVKNAPGAGNIYTATITGANAFGAGTTDANYSHYSGDLTNAAGGIQDNGTLTIAPTAVPEPSSWALFGLGLSTLAGVVSLRQRRAAAAA